MSEEEYMTVGEQIIELLKDELVLGLTYESIKKKLKEKYNREISERGGYVYFKRLKDKGFVKTVAVGQKIKAYRLIPENIRKDARAIKKDFEILKGLFEKEKVQIIGSKITKEEIRLLEAM